MMILVNGEKKSVDGNSVTVAHLLKIEDVTMPDMVSVQINGMFVDRAQYALTVVHENDEIEFLYFMGGGCVTSVKRKVAVCDYN